MPRPVTPHASQVSGAYPTGSNRADVELDNGPAVPTNWTSPKLDESTLAQFDVLLDGFIPPKVLAEAAGVGGLTFGALPAVQADASTWSTSTADYYGEQIPDEPAGYYRPTIDHARTPEWLTGTQLTTGYMTTGELHVWRSRTRPTVEHVDQVRVSGEATVSGVTVPHRPDLGTLDDVPTTWTVTNTIGGVETVWLRSGYMTPAEYDVLHPPVEEPDPDPPAAGITPARVLEFAGLESSDELETLIAAHLPVVTAQVYAYTRGRGFLAGSPNLPLSAIIISAVARSAANPFGVESMQMGELRTRPGIYAGWTLPELAILHTYRARAR